MAALTSEHGLFSLQSFLQNLQGTIVSGANVDPRRMFNRGRTDPNADGIQSRNETSLFVGKGRGWNGCKGTNSGAGFRSGCDKRTAAAQSAEPEQ
ncbi:conserved hypothetical protein [Mesorhizobium delmotii]|uniref:Uncharacterized protein n=1 Tax=Mesorhizobium delmotii TaxID=1631247 RepID=A0A2P9AMU0_9HYPH|nr:conserved hypothetical protein [Mesorhizobium delmotii]